LPFIFIIGYNCFIINKKKKTNHGFILLPFFTKLNPKKRSTKYKNKHKKHHLNICLYYA
jgi:hypothetical protein